ncbi:antitoxin [uncultured Jatrophihabitans sp.]|uniref:antitoxin n=1 Tax=uncultured Jatrophihabitans sp. TaxID=1610747 RepID=UPI0035C944D9
MRTTLSIDDDVLAAVHERARREGKTAGKVLSDLARSVLTAPADATDSEFLGFRPLPRRGGLVTTELIESIRDELAE